MSSHRLLVRAVLSLMLASTVACLPAAVFALTPDDAHYDDQWYLDTIGAPAAWETTTGSRSVVVAVLDTGVDLDHPDLEDNLWVNAGEVAGNRTDDDGNGYADDVYGWDFVDGDANPAPDEVESDVVVSHGTMIAGIIGAAGDNGRGTTGVAWEVRIMALRMLGDDGSGSSSTAAEAVAYAADNGADIINMSFAGVNADTDLRRAIRNAYRGGVVIVSAMGNESEDTDDVAVYPACLKEGEEDWVIGVASTDQSDDPSVFSNYGKNCTDLSAPGEYIYSTMYENPDAGYDEAYGGGWSGTSVASPVVAGAAALLLAAFPDLTPQEVRNTLKLSVDALTLPRELRGEFGAGRVNVARALEVGAQFSDGTTTPDPSMNGGEDVMSEPSVIALGNTSAVVPTVVLHNADGSVRSSFAAYADTFTGGIRVALGEFSAASGAEVVTGTGDGGGPQVRVFTQLGALIGQFFAYDEASRRGVDVAVGDVDGDGADDIVTAVGAGVSRDIVTWSARGAELQRFTASAFAADVPLRVAVGNLDADAAGEFLVASGAGSAPMVALYDTDGTLMTAFAPYAATFAGGVFVAAGDLDGDGVDEVVTGTGDGGGPHVRVFAPDGSVKAQFFAFDATTRHGVRVAAADTDRDGTDEIIAAPGPGMVELRILDGTGAARAAWTVSAGGGEGAAVAAW
ncbi:S8 family serine peptidase [Candidatus Uhrbacteria bacterium]|nr:S8 family serine peptidase [Candidatus Uhrbacteria bacterium]